MKKYENFAEISSKTVNFLSTTTAVPPLQYTIGSEQRHIILLKMTLSCQRILMIFSAIKWSKNFSRLTEICCKWKNHNTRFHPQLETLTVNSIWGRGGTTPPSRRKIREKKANAIIMIIFSVIKSL